MLLAVSDKKFLNDEVKITNPNITLSGSEFAKIAVAEIQQVYDNNDKFEKLVFAIDDKTKLGSLKIQNIAERSAIDRETYVTKTFQGFFNTLSSVGAMYVYKSIDMNTKISSIAFPLSINVYEYDLHNGVHKIGQH